MNVSLTPELDKYVLSKVETGRYNSASEVVREALRYMQDREILRGLQVDEIRRKIEEGADDLRSGRYIEATSQEIFESVTRRGRERIEAKTKAPHAE